MYQEIQTHLKENMKASSLQPDLSPYVEHGVGCILVA